MRRIRAPVVDAIFYPATAEELAREVRSLLERSPIPEGSAQALIVPHAAYSLAGEVLAAGFRAAARREVERVVILAPMHRDPSKNIVLPESQSFLTPLGEIAVDSQALAELEGWSTAIVRSDLPHLEEHAIEVALPFVQVLFPRASLIPLLLGPIPAALTRTLARALAAVTAVNAGKTLFVASTNLNGEQGGRREGAAFLRALGAVRGSRPLRPSTRASAILEGARSGRITACGARAVAVLLEVAGGVGPPRLLARSDSGVQAPRRAYYGAIALG